MRRPLWLVASVAWGIVAACSAFDSSSDPGATDDAGAPPDGADGAVPPGVDASGPTSKDGGAFPCPQRAFCDDFERADLVGAWSNVSSYPAGVSVTLDDTHAKSPTRSLLVTVLPDAGGVAGGGGAFLYRTLPAGTRKIAVSLSTFVQVQPTKNIHAITVVSPDRSYVYFVLNGSGLVIGEQKLNADGGNEYFFEPVAAHVLDAWDRVTLTVDLDRGQAVLDTARGTKTLAFKLPHTALDEVDVGAGFAFAQDARVWIDDVVIQ